MSFIHHTTAVCLALAACLRQRYHSRWYSNSTINSHKDIEEIRSAVNENPDMTLNELIEKLSLPIKKSRLSKLLIKLGFSYKKTLHPKEQLRDDVQQKRSEWAEQQKN